jgi:small-conductance mechanosensitive channel
MYAAHRKQMTTIQRALTLALLVALGAGVYGLVRIRESASLGTFGNAKKAAPQAQLVDQTPLKMAQQLAQRADTPDEQELAKKAVDTADHEVNLAFTQALREATLYPPPLSEEAKEILARLLKAQNILQSDQAEVKRLTAAAQKATGERQDTLNDQLALAKAQADLDQDEVDDAREDLIRSGGDQHGRIQQMQQQRQEAGGDKAVALPPLASGAEQRGLVNRFQQWSAQNQKKRQLAQAKDAADNAAAVLTEQHDALEAQTDAEKFNTPELAAHSSLAEAGGAGESNAAGMGPASSGKAAKRTAEESAALLEQTKRVAGNQQNLASLDKRIDSQKQLSDIYSQWIVLVAQRQDRAIQRMLIGIVIILSITLIAVFLNTWMGKLFDRLRIDKRQVQMLRTITRVSLQVATVLLILLVIFGPPNQLGTFLGLAGAGLTVALKDFIVGFIGWFVLMGKNGIRLGDWVEINGVTGEVVETGLFHTVLLETGNWTDTGHPTGRRVTFTNSFAIEGHYFNFSTSGQWMWDELQVLLPAGQDPYPLIGAIQAKVLEATQESALKAEQEWKRAAGTREVGSFKMAPAISVKPAGGGVELSVRYITRANERYQLRTKLYQAIVDLLGRRDIPPPKPIIEGSASKVA